jgi:predicted nucleotidyltransferase
MLDQADIDVLCEEHGIELLVLFGSRADGKSHPGSDIDLAVKIRPHREVSKLELIFRLGGLFDDGEIDLVLLTRDTDPLLLHEIFTKGRPLHEAQAGIFDAERLRAWKLYLDTEDLRKMQVTYLRKFAEKTDHVA